jgi:sulfur-oxidizing protein SoxA
MRRGRLYPVLSVAVWLAAAATAISSPSDDLSLYQGYFLRRFPRIDLGDFGNGAYALDRITRENWNAIEEFPPYDPGIDRGEALWNMPFANGSGYADCFGGNPAQRKNYPRWDPQRAEVITLALAINRCREANSEPPLDYGRGPIAQLLAYMAYESRGQITEVDIPPHEQGAIQAYEAGKAFYFRRRGQLNFACSNCHMESAGQHLRTETISPSLGQTTGWPTYRLEWGELGTLHRRFADCNGLIRAKPFPLQSAQYRNLEYFLTHMSNGIPYNGPASRN